MVSGAVERGETLLEAVRRALVEEAGADLRVEVLGTVHAWNRHYDERVPNMISAAFVASYLGGHVTPSDDLDGCSVRWATVAEIRHLASDGQALIPGDVRLFERALQCFDLWHRAAKETAELP